MKNTITIAIICALLILTGCAASNKDDSGDSQSAALVKNKSSKDTNRTFIGKPQAPVQIMGNFKESPGIINLLFLSKAENVGVALKGVDGLVVLDSSPSVTKENFDKGDSVQISVNFDYPVGRSYLAVFVSGLFSGRAMTKTKSFVIGSQSVLQKQQKNKNAITDSEGRKVIIMPAERR